MEQVKEIIILMFWASGRALCSNSGPTHKPSPYRGFRDDP